MINTLWLGFITKIIELLDTVFFILRKKNNQLSFLHVIHHGKCSRIFPILFFKILNNDEKGCLPLNCWFALKFVGGGFGTFGCLLNCFVHFVMYFYYFLAAYGDRFKKYLWWMKYLTAMQIVSLWISLC